MLSTRDPPQNKRFTQAESEKMEKIFYANGHQKKAEVAILISDKIDLKTKPITRDKEGHYIILKGAIQPEDINLININAPYSGALKYIKKILVDFKEEINTNTVIVGSTVTTELPEKKSIRKE